MTPVSIELARTPTDAGMVTELAAAEKALLLIDREILQFEGQLRFLAQTEPVSAAHAVRRAELAQRIRTQLDWLAPVRAELRAELEREEAGA